MRYLYIAPAIKGIDLEYKPVKRIPRFESNQNQCNQKMAKAQKDKALEREK